MSFPEFVFKNSAYSPGFQFFQALRRSSRQDNPAAQLAPVELRISPRKQLPVNAEVQMGHLPRTAVVRPRRSDEISCCDKRSNKSRGSTRLRP